jgi:pyruvate dehydrogenase E2 component (dihydrolipoamide acetyltransferase)
MVHAWVALPWSRLVKVPIEWVPILVVIGQIVETFESSRKVIQKKPTGRANAALVDAVHARARHQVGHQDVKDRYRHISLAMSTSYSALTSRVSLRGASGARQTLRSTSRPGASASGAVKARTRVSVKAEIKEIMMPALSSTMTEGKIVSWLMSEGDTIGKGDAVVVVESDKADMDVESFVDGIIAHIMVEDGEVATVGAPIAYVVDSEDEIAAAKAKAGGGGAAAAAPAPAAQAPAAAAPAPAAAAPAPAAAAPAPAAAAPTPAAAAGRIVATPYAKKLAKKHKVDINAVRGTGLNGRITAIDIETAAGVPPTPKAGAAPAAAPAKAAPAAAKAAPVAPPAPVGTITPLAPMQAAVAKNMLPSLSVPVSRVAMKICTDEFDKLYATLKPKGVTMTALLTKAVGVALAQHPLMFSTYVDGQGIIYNDKVNIAVAVALPSGLITPVLKDTAGTDVYQLGRDWSALVKKARGSGLAPADYAGGTFTISNMGMFGVSAFDAILPPGQTAILAVGGSEKTVVPVNGMIGVKTIMTVNCTADHRHVNGDVVAAFLVTLKETIENPSSLTL